MNTVIHKKQNFDNQSEICTFVLSSVVKDASHGLKTVIHLYHHSVDTVDYKYLEDNQATKIKAHYFKSLDQINADIKNKH